MKKKNVVVGMQVFDKVSQAIATVLTAPDSDGDVVIKLVANDYKYYRHHSLIKYPELKVGDKVRIVITKEMMSVDYYDAWVDALSDFNGQVHTIDRIGDGSCVVEETGFYFHRSMMHLIKD